MPAQTPSVAGNVYLVQLRSHVESLRQKFDQIEEAQRQLMIRNATLYGAAVSPTDIKQVLFDCIDSQARHYIKTVARSGVYQQLAKPNYKRPMHDQRSPELIQATHVGRINLADLEMAQSQIKSGFTEGVFGCEGGFDLFPLELGEQSLRAGWFYFFFGDLAKKKLDQHFDALIDLNAATGGSGPVAQMSLSARRQEIERNDEQWRELQQEKEKLKAELDEIYEQGFRI